MVVTSNNYLHIGQFDSVNSKYYNYRYEIGSHSFDDYYRMPVVGNLDSDDDLEIAVWGEAIKRYDPHL